MRVRVRFRYRADTGEVEAFTVDDLGGDQRAAGHDLRHDRVTADVARIIEQNALIEEVLPGSTLERQTVAPTAEEDAGTPEDRRISE